jgi:hypothetical protein
VASLGTNRTPLQRFNPRLHGQTHRHGLTPGYQYSSVGSAGSPLVLASIVLEANRVVCTTPSPIHTTVYIALSSHAWRLVGAIDRRLPISRGRSMVRRSKAPPYKPTHHHLTTAPRQRGTTAAVAPHIHARLPAVERAWDDKWRVLCIETSALGSRWMRRYSSGATAGTYAYSSTSGRRIPSTSPHATTPAYLSLTRLGGPRRNKHPANQGKVVESPANRHEFIHQTGFPSRPCPHVTGEPGYSGRIS